MVPSRFKRDYELVVGVDGNRTVTVKPPIRISFRTNKSVEGGQNNLTVRLYNLQESNRRALVKDAEQAKYVPLSLSVGYDKTLHLIFKGSIFRGESFREGPDLVTQLDSQDGWFDGRYAFTSRTIHTKEQAVDGVLQDMTTTEKGKISTLQPILRPKILVGNSLKLIDDMVGDGETWYIEDEKLYIIKDDEVVRGFNPVVSAETGLLNTPTREQSLVTFETLMNPTLKIGALCSLQTVTAPHLNGTYKILSMSHAGDNYGADWLQQVTGRRVSAPKVV